MPAGLALLAGAPAWLPPALFNVGGVVLTGSSGLVLWQQPALYMVTLALGALVLALRITRASDATTVAHLMATVTDVFAQELEPHFRDEQAHLLPGLAAAGAQALVRRTLEEHHLLRGLAARVAAGDAASLSQFGEALRAHVRFEEHELFVAAEVLLPAETLDAAPPEPRAAATCRLGSG